MNTKAKGSKNELKAKKLLELAGFTVIKSGGSFGTWDLIAWNNTKIRFIQVKTNKMPPLKEINQIKAAVVPLAATKELWIFKDYQKDPKIVVYS